MDNIIIATGCTLDKDLLRNIVKQYENPYIIGVDKGLETLNELNIKPDLALGDFDSASEKIKELYIKDPETIILNPKKDYTDTHVAVMKALSLKPKQIHILGATGSRLHHVMANFGMLKHCLLQGVCAYIIDSCNRIRMIDKQCKISKRDAYGKYISCVPFSDKVTGINLRGFVYPLTDATMIKEDSIGISNELREEEGLISIDTGYLLVMETKDS